LVAVAVVASAAPNSGRPTRARLPFASGLIRTARSRKASASGSVSRCAKKYKGKTKKQRQAKKHCIARAKRESFEQGAKKQEKGGSPSGSGTSAAPGANPSPGTPANPTPTPSPTPSQEPAPTPEEPAPTPDKPDTTIDAAPPAVISHSSVTLTFHSDHAGASFECSLNGVAWSRCGSPAEYSSLSDGFYGFAVRAMEGELVDPTPATASWTVDTVPPQTTISAGPSGLTDNRQGTFTFGSSESGSRFECELDSGGWQSCASPKGYASLADGTHEFEARAIDAAGNVDPSPASSSWTVDTVPPQTTITAGPEDPTESSQASFSFDSSKPGLTFECELDSGGWQSCVSPKSYDSLPDAIHRFEVRATDLAGNVDPTPAEASWTVDTPPPSTTKVAGPEGRIGTGPVALEFSSADAGATFVCSLDGAASSPCSSPDHLPDPGPGPHTFVVKAVDGVGNADPAGVSYGWDSVSPKLSLCGDISGHKTIGPRYAGAYVVTCGVIVDEGAALDVEPGALLKFESNSELRVQGTLEAVGSPSEPVVFTSWRDDTVGGDTNGDGSASGPVAGDWAGIYASPGGQGNEKPTLKLDHVKVNYARTAIDASEAAASVIDSTIEKAQYDGIEVTSSVGVPTLTGNTVDHVGQVAISVRSAAIDMGKLDGNSGAGNGLNGVDLSADTVTVSSALPWTGNLIPVLYGGCEALRVPPGVKLTLGPGAIVKGEANCGDELRVQGTLEAAGTSAEPVVFTSWRDDTVGGDTNGDGSATGPERGDWGGIYASPAGSGNEKPTLKLDHVRVAYSSTAIYAQGTLTSITSSTIEKARGDGIEVVEPVGVPTVTGNTVKQVSNVAISVRQASLDMGKLNGNSGSGNELNGVELSSDAVTVSSALPWSGNLLPVLTGGCGSSLTVPAGVKLTMGPGTIVKAHYNCGGEVIVHGTLEAAGTTAEPVVFTSWRDDTVGGDTNGDGSATGPEPGDWSGISAYPEGNGTQGPTLALSHFRVAYSAGAVRAQEATTSITNGQIEKSMGDGIEVQHPVGLPTVTGNAVEGVGHTAISIREASIDMGKLNGNSGSKNELNAIELANDTVTVSSALPWSGNLVPVLTGGCGSSLTVPAGVKLVLGAGTIVKAHYNCGGEVIVHGTLEAAGTSTEPVVLTSWRDDSVGGDTNGDGSATGPEPGDWGGVNASPAGSGTEKPSLKLKDVDISYASTGVQSQEATTSIVGAKIEHTLGDGIDVLGSVGVPTVSGNTIVDAATAISVQSASIDMGKLNGNSGSGNELNGVRLGSDTVSVSSSLPWTGNLVPVLYGGCSALQIPPGVKLTMGPGAIVKAEANCGAEIQVQGTLEAAGTAAEPVVFTSWRDDSVGGDTNGDGSATGPVAGDWGGIGASPAGNGNEKPTLSLSHVKVSYSNTAIRSSQANTSITSSTIEKVRGDGIEVTSPVGVPTITGNTVKQAAGVAISIQSASIDMGKLNGNSGSGNELNGVQLGSDTVTVSSSLPWTGNLIPVLYGGCSALQVPPGVKLTMGPGTIVKAQANCGAELLVQGTLEAAGTAAEPVVFTSWRDDSVGGDTNGDGSATGPVAGDWGGIGASPAGNGNETPTLKLDHVKVSYSNTAIRSSQATTQVSLSTIEKVRGAGIEVNSPVGVPTITGNTVKQATIAISVQSASIDMGKLNGNSGSGNELNGVQLGSDTVVVSSALPWTGNLIPVLYGGCSALRVPPGVKLTMGPGTIVKAEANCGAELQVQGTLEAAGTAAEPVVLTSWRDDSVGGDTNGDGSTTGPLAGDWGGIGASPAGSGNETPTLKLDHVRVAYAYNAVLSREAATSITNSSIEHAQGEGISISSPNGAPTVTGNSVVGAAGTAIRIETASLDLARLNANSGSGNGANQVQLGNDTVIGSSAGAWSGSLPPVLQGGLTLEPAVTARFSTLSGSGSIQMNGTGNFALIEVAGVAHIGEISLSIGSNSFAAVCGESVTALRAGSTAGAWLGVGGSGLPSGGSWQSSVSSTSAGAFVYCPPPPVPSSSTFGYGSSSDGINPSGYAAEPVDTATGAYNTSEIDASMPGLGVPFDFTRSYTSSNPYSGPLGLGWTDSLNVFLSAEPSGEVLLSSENGQRTSFRPTGGGSYEGQTGTRSKLEQTEGSGWLLVRQNQERLRFDSAGRLTSEVDRDGDGLTLSYDGAGQLANVKEYGGREVRFVYDASGLLETMSLPLGRVVRYGYDAQGRLTSVTDAAGVITRYTYNAEGLLATVINQDGKQVVANSYDPSGRVVKQVNALGGTGTFSYGQGVTTYIDPGGGEWTDTYAGNVLVGRTDPEGDKTTYAYDSSLDQTAVTDPEGNTTTMSYDARGNMLSETLPLGHTQSWTYDTLNDPTSHVDGDGNKTSYGYDGKGNLLEVEFPDEATVTETHDPASGALTSITDASDHTTTYSYNAAGELTAVGSPLGETTTYSYDAAGRRLTMVSPRGHTSAAVPADYTTTFGYDADDRLTGVTDPEGHLTEIGYDAVGNRTSLTDPDGHTTSWGYDAENQLTSTTDAAGATTNYGYDPAGNRTSITTPLGHLTKYGYDAVGRLISVTDPLGHRTAYRYDADGRRTSLSDPTGASTTYSYDADGELTGRTYSDGTPAVTFRYDAAGNRTAMSDGTGTTTIGYDSVDRLTSVEGPAGDFSYAYDGNGNVTSRGYPDGSTVAESYDADGRLASITADGQKTTYGYDPDSDLTAVGLPAANGYEEAAGYDRAGRLVSIADKKAAATLSSFAYTYDAAGNPTGVTTASGPIAYGYDEDGRLTSACYGTSCAEANLTYAYDADGERTKLTDPSGTTHYSYDEADELKRTEGPGGTTTYGYDADGRRTSAGTTTYAWNAADLLTHLTTPSSTTAYAYDGDGNRVSETTGARTTAFSYDIDNPLPLIALEHTNEGASRRYVWGDGRLLSMRSGNGDYYAAHDAQGSVVGLTSAAGATEATFSYDPFGNARTSHLAAGAPEIPLRYEAQRLDPSGLYHLAARQMDPATGSFISQDPLTPSPFQPAISPYVYANDRPTVLADPAGESSSGSDYDLDQAYAQGVAEYQFYGNLSSALGSPAGFFGSPAKTGAAQLIDNHYGNSAGSVAFGAYDVYSAGKTLYQGNNALDQYEAQTGLHVY
jgi:RHS repeat-associated protein